MSKSPKSRKLSSSPKSHKSSTPSKPHKSSSSKDPSLKTLPPSPEQVEGSLAALEEGKAHHAPKGPATGRRRGDDPTTCDPDYSPEELEFLMAIQQYKQATGRKFPTWREVLEILRSLGYERAR
ncbi:hypothetical protein V5E97_04790 [Singulisphaera sp. Ch08]|uniref:Uncharacterized protein n=1 Tax=Singulisphaera sp. Ch08 TaxID=3120278 RepID=A0AAU7CK06_9BACT